METVTDVILGGSKITEDGDCSHEITRCLLLGRKAMTNLDSILKSRDITLSTKVHLVKAMVFPVVIYGCKSWIIKKAEHQRMLLLNCGVGEDSLESLGLQGDPISPSLRKSVLNIHWKDWCWSWNSSTLATRWEDLTHWERASCWERLKAGEEGDIRGWDGWMAWPTQWTWVWVNSRSWWWTRRLGVLQFMGSQRVGHDWATELNWKGDKGLPGWLSGKESSCQYRKHRRHRFDPWVRKIPGEGNGNLLHYSCLENSIGRGAWQATVHGVANTQIWMSD